MDIYKKNLDGVEGMPVISGALKIIIPVPKIVDGLSDFVYPAGPHKGQPLMEWDDNLKKEVPMTGKGIVLYNAVDDKYQAFRTDGNDVMIINNVPLEDAKKIVERANLILSTMMKNGGVDLVNYIKKVGDYARKLGYPDMYNSDKKYVSQAMERVGPGDINDAGLYNKTKEIQHAYGVRKLLENSSGESIFHGTAGPQSIGPDDVIVVNSSNESRKIAAQPFHDTYTNPDGSQINDDDLPQVKPLENDHTITKPQQP